MMGKRLTADQLLAQRPMDTGEVHITRKTAAAPSGATINPWVDSQPGVLAWLYVVEYA